MVPASINAKSWSMVMDNPRMTGTKDGRQGGDRAQISVQVSVLQDGSLTVVHDLYAVLANTSTWLTEDDGLVLDAGHRFRLRPGPWTAPPTSRFDRCATCSMGIEGQHAPDSGTALLDVSTSSTLTWTVPPSLDGVPMHLMLDSGDAIIGGAPPDDLRTTVRLTLDPPMNPTVQDDGNGSTTLCQPLLLDASSTLIASTAWWIGCGIWTRTPTRTTTVTPPTTVHGHSESTSATWNQPGTYTVTVHVRDVDGRTAMAQHQVSVTDVVAPTAKISSLGKEQPVDDGYRLDPEAVLAFVCPSTEPPRGRLRMGHRRCTQWPKHHHGGVLVGLRRTRCA